MDQFKHVFNTPSLYETLFFDVVTTTEYESYSKFMAENYGSYLHWMNYAKKKYGQVDGELYMETASYLPEYAEIKAIAYGGYYLDQGSMKSYHHVISNKDENEIIDEFFGILNRFKTKHQDGYLCGHNMNGFHIPMLIKRGLKHGFKIPKSIKNNLIAKPWENAIIDTLDLWKFNGNGYVTLESIANFFNLKSRIEYEKTNQLIWDGKLSASDIASHRYEVLVRLYSKLRNM